ncbi:hypothetical protein POM88_006247 [Heracleum sosnowskyi]|uniref:Ubiquitin-like protease family profile domain-containing protein n=1 Tax=Heracleum sosnowskyi TaxID=360622 RepID=A0AAD8J2D3_9APIA|nr:hypothetical protein POM88_006247 [Heracleum sosnowskyi]
MSEGRRRSGRLIQSPWLYKGPKKRPAFVILDASPTIEKFHVASEGGLTTVNKDISTNVVGLSGVEMRRLNVGGNLDVRSERRIYNRAESANMSDEDDVFVTPGEHFGDSSKTLNKGRNKLKLVREKNATEMNLGRNTGVGVVVGHGSNSRKRNMEVEFTQHRRMSARKGSEQSKSILNSKPPEKNYKVIVKVLCSIETPSLVAPRRRKLVIRNVKKAKGSVMKDDAPKNMKKSNPVRTYDGYIQKKFSPTIMTDIIMNLSESQIKWVRLTGFGLLLNFRMISYTHYLGYNVVEAFDGETCSLKLKEGNIKITYSSVHRVIGLPNGTQVIKCDEDKSAYSKWAEKFPGCPSSEVTPIMETHKYWASNKKRNFAGSLPFLIYLYVSKVQNKSTTSAPKTFPAYRGWSDMLLRERQKNDLDHGSFGDGELVKLLKRSGEGNGDEAGERLDEGSACNLFGEESVDGLEDGDKQDNWEREECNERNELTMQDIVVRSDLQIMDGRNKEDESDVLNMICFDDNVDVRKLNLIASNVEDIPYKDEGLNMDCDNDGIYKQDYNLGRVEHLMYTDNGENDDVRTKSIIILYWATFTSKHSAGAFQPANTETTLVQMEIPKWRGADNMMTSVGVDVVQNTHSCDDQEIEKHFEENTYMISFENNLKEFVDVYGRCLNNFEVSLALYPQNLRLAELKKDYSQYFKMFEAASPIAKHLLVGNVVDKAGKKTTILNEADFIPNYSLGLSQLTPKNLRTELEGISNSPKKGHSQLLSLSSEGQLVPKLPLHEKDANRIGGVNGNATTEIVRPRREIKASHLCRSPYVSRVVDVSSHVINTEESNVWQCLFQNRKNRKENLFEWNGRMCTKAHFQSLQDIKMVMSTVIDSWTYLLNENEILKADSSPLRLFMTTETTYGPLKIDVGGGSYSSKIGRYAAFDDNMDIVIKMVNEMHNKHYEVKDFDMFVFPIFNAAHFYIICYNMKKTRLEIIDNRVQTAGVEETYGDLTAKLHDCFCHWISIYDLPKKDVIFNLKPRVQRMGWQTEMNSVDCGIFVMRHMETYMGSLWAWKVGLCVEKDNQRPLLNKLRIIYCHSILTWSKNSKKFIILDDAANFAKGKKLVT